MCIDLLRELADLQNGPPLVTYEKQWNDCMDRVYEYLNKAEQAAELRGKAGGWVFETALKEHAFSLELAWYIYQLVWRGGTVYDFGAGPGFYTQFLKERGVNCHGFDYSSHAGLSLTSIAFIDLSKPFKMIGKASTVLCLEVGEHIESEFESVVIDNICHHAKEKIIMSWAIPGQGGYGHVNCQPNDYIIATVERHGWVYNAEESQLLRDHCSACPWFENTIMVFDKK